MTTDLSSTIVAKSDQLNSDDLIGGPITITITKVSVKVGGEQPTSINYEGDNGKPYKPGKSMCRVLVAAWGTEGADYIGRQLTLYRDPDISFGPTATGGIRISHMSHIKSVMSMPLTVKKGSKKMFTVKPLINESVSDIAATQDAGKKAAAGGLDALKKWWGTIGGAKQNAIGGASFLDELKKIAEKSVAASGAVNDVAKSDVSGTDDIPNV